MNNNEHMHALFGIFTSSSRTPQACWGILHNVASRSRDAIWLVARREDGITLYPKVLCVNLIRFLCSFVQRLYSPFHSSYNGNKLCCHDLSGERHSEIWHACCGRKDSWLRLQPELKCLVDTGSSQPRHCDGSCSSICSLMRRCIVGSSHGHKA